MMKLLCRLPNDPQSNPIALLLQRKICQNRPEGQRQAMTYPPLGQNSIEQRPRRASRVQRNSATLHLWRRNGCQGYPVRVLQSALNANNCGQSDHHRMSRISTNHLMIQRYLAVLIDLIKRDQHRLLLRMAAHHHQEPQATQNFRMARNPLHLLLHPQEPKSRLRLRRL